MKHINIITASLFTTTLISAVHGSGNYLRRQHSNINAGRELLVDGVVLEDLFEGNSYNNSDNNPVESFLGIQYATVSERFDPSEVLEIPTNGPPINATAYGDSCTQYEPLFDLPSTSEDCLYLNIWRPTTAGDIQHQDELLPVMVFIPGGAYVIGSGSQPSYDGSNLAGNKNVIVVTINYRLGIFGFLPTDDEGTGGMNGHLDQIHALKWIQKYIGLFGGNPDLVTIFGESGGSNSVTMLSVIPEANGLFKRAIVESGTFTDYQTAEEGTDMVNTMLEQIGNCDGNCTIEDLKTQETNVLNKFWFGVPTRDYTLLPQETYTLYSEGKINPTDMIIGTNTYDDFTLPPINKPEDYIKTANTSITESNYWVSGGMDKWDKERQQAAIDAYSPTDYYNGSNVAAFAQFQADVEFVCPSRDFTETAARTISGSVYSYEFGYLSEHDTAITSGLLEMANVTDPTWASHGVELAFVFGNFAKPLSEHDKHFSEEIMERWANFARHGTPFHLDPKVDEWVPVTTSSSSETAAADPNHLLFTENGSTAIQSDKRKVEQCSAIYTSPDVVPTDSKTNDPQNNNSSAGVAMKNKCLWLTAAVVLGGVALL